MIELQRTSLAGTGYFGSVDAALLPLGDVDARAPDHCPAPSSVEQSVIIATSLADVEALKPEWLALEALAAAPLVFQSYGQITTWIRHFAAGNDRLRVVVVRQAGRAVLILPLVVSGTPVLRIGRMAGDPIAQYSDALIDLSADLDAAFAAAMSALARCGIDVLVLRRIRDDSHLKMIAGDRLTEPTSQNAAPFADLSPYRDYQAYLQSLSKNMRKGLRNRRHHLDKAGGMSFELFPGGPEARAVLEDAVDLKKRWLIQRGAVSSAFLAPNTRACLLDLAEDNRGCGSVVMRLLVNGEPAAIRFGFEYGGTYYAYLSAYDERHANMSPGKMLMDAYLAHFAERKVRGLDMMAPLDRHKTDWCADKVGVGDYTLPLSVQGRAYAGFYQERLRPAMYKAWRALPAGVRSAIAALLISV